ncbi:lectin-like protein [Olea europaea var. sylvestris]|uniref:L-type lectin-domain containing receptor kinase -like n=1 Tax=Olea europaea subsp. europaea TaxID=158383 RepID=A0A8S0QJA8_OLEEU|nr:lectin-like protein [Olea europaea var. sylvestris]CAA2968027.1 L-type lectin-domain containing receptor kinase -like [Olea europaea subsp. europaea]
MVTISIPIFSRPLCHLISFIIFLVALFSAPHFSLSLSNRPYFDPNLVLIGDAKFTNNGLSIQLNDPKNSFPSSGCMIQKKPIKIFSSKSRPIRPISFSTDFTFSISPHSGDGLAFILVSRKFMLKFQKKDFGLPRGSPFFAVEYDTFLDENLGDVNSNHVGIDVGSLVSMKTSNVSSINLVLNSGVKLHSWIDYDSSSKRLEVRLSKFGLARPYDPLLVYPIDLGEMWRNGEVFVGLSSSSGNSMQTGNVYSWKFKTRSVPNWLHSKPVDPQVFSNVRSEEKRNNRRWVCVLGFLSGFITIVGCGAIIALVIMFVWAIIENSRETIVTVPTTCMVQPGDFKYQKINVVINDNSVDVKH